jgi:hypothetical protein
MLINVWSEIHVCGENGKVSVVKKRKEKGYMDALVRN